MTAATRSRTERPCPPPIAPSSKTSAWGKLAAVRTQANAEAEDNTNNTIPAELAQSLRGSGPCAPASRGRPAPRGRRRTPPRPRTLGRRGDAELDAQHHRDRHDQRQNGTGYSVQAPTFDPTAASCRPMARQHVDQHHQAQCDDNCGQNTRNGQRPDRYRRDRPQDQHRDTGRDRLAHRSGRGKHCRSLRFGIALSFQFAPHDRAHRGDVGDLGA